MEKEKYLIWVLGKRSAFFFIIFLLPGMALSLAIPLLLGMNGIWVALFTAVSLAFLLWQLPRIFGYQLELIIHDDYLCITPLKQATFSPIINKTEVDLASVKTFTSYGQGGRNAFHKIALRYNNQELNFSARSLLSVNSVLRAERFARALKTKLREKGYPAQLEGEEFYWRSASMKWQLAISFSLLLAFIVFSIHQITVNPSLESKGSTLLITFNVLLLLGWYSYFWRKFRKYNT